MKKFLILASVLTIVSVFGCINQASHVPNSIPSVGSSLDQSRAHLDAAEQDVQAARPHADPTGKAILVLASQQHKDAGTKLSEAGRELSAVQGERDHLVKDNANLSAQNARLVHSWGYRFQVFVTRAFWILVALAVLHAALASAAFLLPLFFPAAAVAVPFLSLGAKIINPFGWFTVLAGHAQTRYLMNAAAKPGVN